MRVVMRVIGDGGLLQAQQGEKPKKFWFQRVLI
jgi:hypothetical protein